MTADEAKAPSPKRRVAAIPMIGMLVITIIGVITTVIAMIPITGDRLAAPLRR